MFITVILGFILGLLLGISLLLDAKDGKIDTDLYACSVYVVSIGALVTLSSIPKIAIESKRIKYGQDIKMEEKTLSQLPHLNEGGLCGLNIMNILLSIFKKIMQLCEFDKLPIIRLEITSHLLRL